MNKFSRDGSFVSSQSTMSNARAAKLLILVTFEHILTCLYDTHFLESIN